MKKKKTEWGKHPVPPSDEILFYRYVVCKTKVNMIPDSKIIQVAQSHNINLIFHPSSKNISTKVKDGTIELTGYDEESSANSFAVNRHLRNAFCHLNIIVDDDKCFLRDSSKSLQDNKIQTTMSGRVNYSDLKELIKSMNK